MAKNLQVSPITVTGTLWFRAAQGYLNSWLVSDCIQKSNGYQEQPRISKHPRSWRYESKCSITALSLDAVISRVQPVSSKVTPAVSSPLILAMLVTHLVIQIRRGCSPTPCQCAQHVDLPFTLVVVSYSILKLWQGSLKEDLKVRHRSHCGWMTVDLQ